MYIEKQLLICSTGHPRLQIRQTWRIQKGGRNLLAGIAARSGQPRKGRYRDVRNGREMVAGLTAKRKQRIMKVELIIPIDSLRGKLRQDGFYFRKYRGQQIVQKCPDRSKHVKTEDEAANQRRFAAKYAGKRKREMASRTTDDVNRHSMPENKQNINPPDTIRH